MNFQGSSNWRGVEDKYFARGGNSLVFKVVNDSGELYALKLFNYESASDERLNRFISEIDVVKRVSGVDGCVSYVDHGLHENKPFYVMPFYESGTIRDKYFGAVRREVSEVVTDFKKTILVVKSIHGLGLAIRDIKPQNLLIDGEGNPIIADFGLSLWIDMPDEERLTSTMGVVGSQGYRPPEWHSQYPNPNHRPGDIWSLGRTLWALTAGRNPPPNYETLGGAGTHLNQYVEKKVANLLQSIVSSCTVQDPAGRPTIEELIDQVSYVANSISDSNEQSSYRKGDIADAISKFGMGVSSSETYIDSKRLDSEINIKIEQVVSGAELITTSLKSYVDKISAAVPGDLGKFSVISHMPGGVFIDERQVTIQVSPNRAWGKVCQLRYTPSEMMKLHKGVNYVDLSFFIGLTIEKQFYWIIQLRDQTATSVKVIEQIETKFLSNLIDNKISQLDYFVAHFIGAVEAILA